MYNVVELWLLLKLLQGGLISVHGLKGYGPSHWVHLGNRKDDAASQLSVPFLSLGLQPLGWCQSHA